MFAAATRGALLRATKAAAASARSTMRTTANAEPQSVMFRNLARAYAARSDTPSVIAEPKEGTPGEMPSILDQAAGLERAEIDNPDLFKHNEVLRGPFGTTENPVKIQSNYDARIVGCTGKAAPDDHDLIWISVEKGKQFICSICGQVFVLDPL